VRSANPIRQLLQVRKMPVLLELHLTEDDRVGYQLLRQRHAGGSATLPQLSFLGRFLGQLDVESADLAPAERKLTRKLRVYADLLESNRVDMVALDDGSRGRDSLDNAIAAELLIGLGAAPERIMANVVGRNRTPDQIRSRLVHLAELGLRNALLLTGDLPVEAGRSAVYPLDSVGMCELARSMLIQGSLPEEFLIAAAGHPNPDADPEGIQALHKVLAGANLIVTQAIYSTDHFGAWMDSLRHRGVLDVAHVLPELIPVTSSRQLRIVSKVPGVHVPDSLVTELEDSERRIESDAAARSEAWARSARNREAARVTRELLHSIRSVPGASGFYLGSIGSFAPHLELLRETPLLPDGATRVGSIARLDDSERQRALAQLPRIEVWLGRLTRRVRAEGLRASRRLLRGIAGLPGAAAALRITEAPKGALFGCKKCDQCDLSVDALVCPRGCAKQMSHGPCGAVHRVDGRMLCEDETRECTWARIRSRRQRAGIARVETLKTRRPPSPGFYEGETFSAFLPVFRGEREGPQWGLVARAAWACLGGGIASANREKAAKLDLADLVATRTVQLREMLLADPQMDREELLVKALALVGTPGCNTLIESRLQDFGLPAEGTLADLSLRDKFLLAEALPAARRRLDARKSSRLGPDAQAAALLEDLPGAHQLRRAVRRERANSLIQHLASLGMRVTYSDVLLDSRFVDVFLQGLTTLKNDQQRARLRDAREQDLPASLRDVSVHFERIHYKRHYRPGVSLRRFYADSDGDAHRDQLVVDLRQLGSAHGVQLAARQILGAAMRGESGSEERIALEEFTGESSSILWAFNRAFWFRLGDFERATGIAYDESIGGSTDRNLSYVRSTARGYFDAARKLPGSDRLYVVEIGVASAKRAREFLGELERISRIHRVPVYERTAYLLADYSDELLDKARLELQREHPSVEAVRIDAAEPEKSLSRYRGALMHAHLCNVYDNLPAERFYWNDGRLHRTQVRLYVPRRDLLGSVERHFGDTREVDELDRRLRQLATSGEDAVPSLLAWIAERLEARGKDPLGYVGFWMDLTAALRLDERHRPVSRDDELSDLQLPGIDRPASLLRALLDGQGPLHFHVNHRALSGFVGLLQLLHPAGRIEVVDLFVERMEEYGGRFKGPIKFDGTTVNWLNGPLFRSVAEALGYEVRFSSFRPFDPKSVSVVLQAGRAGGPRRGLRPESPVFPVH
jgi:5,10-methylenetetrahydrofolate reductase